MADAFVDLYEVLELPLDADRVTIRKKINELYLEAQRNLDHRNFQTRVKYQELFEVTLPQARYILLDDGRRDQYDALVRSARAPKGTMAGGPTAPSSAPAAGGFKVADDPNSALPGQAPAIEPIPAASIPQITPEERDAQWAKWKSGLAEVLERETKDEAPKPRAEPKPEAPKRETKERPAINFDFGDENAPRRGESAPVPGAEELVEEAKARLDPKEVERRRTEHRRQIMKEILVGEGLKGMGIGAAMVVVPGLAGMFLFMGHFYPRGKEQLLPVPEGLMWMIWLLALGAGTFFMARGVSKALRKKRGAQLAKLSYDDIVKLSGRPM